MDRDEDTLSFTSLVQPNNPRLSLAYPKQLTSAPSFEFQHYPKNCTILSNNVSPIDRNGSSRRRRCMRQGNDRKSTDKGTPKKVSFQENLPMTKSSASSPEKRNEVAEDMQKIESKKKGEKSKGLLGSIILACRGCRAVEPTTKRVGDVVS